MNAVARKGSPATGQFTLGSGWLSDRVGQDRVERVGNLDTRIRRRCRLRMRVWHHGRWSSPPGKRPKNGLMTPTENGRSFVLCAIRQHTRPCTTPGRRLPRCLLATSERREAATGT
jgi:hypothetical protein